MKKSDINIQNENAILMAIAIADGYMPLSEKEYDKEFKKRMRASGIDNYKEAFNYVYAGMPQYVGDDAIFCGKITLANKDHEFIDLALGNNEQYKDEYTDISRKIVSEYINYHLDYENVEADDVLQDKYTMYNFLKTYVLPNLLKDRYNIANKQIDKDNILAQFEQSDALNTLFDYKFSAFKHYNHSRGKHDETYYALTHGMIDSVIDLYSSLTTACDELDIDIRSISPYPNEELGITLPEGFEMEN